jgi:hypothetical protein
MRLLHHKIYKITQNANAKYKFAIDREKRLTGSSLSVYYVYATGAQAFLMDYTKGERA